jgi:hypothetical protein
MPALTSILAATAIAAAAAGTAVQIDAGNKSRQQAKDAADKQANQQAGLEQQAKDQQASVDASNAQQMARKKQQAAAAGAQGRADTLLTGPMGAVGQAPTAGKTLLGT